MQNDKDLLKRAQNGDVAAFSAIYSMYSKELYRYALKYLGNTYDAEDAVSESTVKVFKNVKNIKNPNSLKAYYFKTLSNCAKTMLKAKIPETVPPEITEHLRSNVNIEDEVSVKNDVNFALLKLNQEEREIVLLSAVGGFSSREIAKIVDMTAGAVRSKLSRSYEKMRNALGGLDLHTQKQVTNDFR